MSREDDARAIADARRALGIERLVFGIQDASFPMEPDEDLGRGSAGSRGAERLLEHVSASGFDGVQLGPQGETTRDNPSPYDTTWFSRDECGAPVARLAAEEWNELLGREALAGLVRERAPAPPDRVRHPASFDLQRRALDLAFAALRARAEEPAVRGLTERLEALSRGHESWLRHMELFTALEREHAGAPFALWPELDRRLTCPPSADAAPARARERELRARHAVALARYRFGQLVAHAEHGALRARARALGLALYADAQVGCAAPDRWAHAGLFLPGYRMGAPPSRTNPDGQPWDYPVFDPELAGKGAPAFALLEERMSKLFEEYDAIRIDHPHGYVCPWVYRAEGADRGAALRAGARLRSSPDLADHPELGRFAIAAPAQLARDAAVRRHDDAWVRELRPEQIAHYGELFDAIVASARRHGRSAAAIVCEVLSTQPEPLRLVLSSHRIGRFRVTQKADVSRADDVYRVENAAPHDWVMVGNHDTPPIWRLATEWVENGRAQAQAAHLALRLEPDAARRAAAAERLARDPAALAHAKLSELFLGPARNVYVFFTDALGVREVYNAPGTITEANWSLRLTPDWELGLRERLSRGAALSVPRALACALRARGLAGTTLVGKLERLVGETGLQPATHAL